MQEFWTGPIFYMVYMLIGLILASKRGRCRVVCSATALFIIGLDKGNPKLRRGTKRAYNVGKSRHEKVSKLECERGVLTRFTVTRRLIYNLSIDYVKLSTFLRCCKVSAISGSVMWVFLVDRECFGELDANKCTLSKGNRIASLAGKPTNTALLIFVCIPVRWWNNLLW